MSDNFNFLYSDELLTLKLRELYESSGFKKFRMSKFESYDFYARNKDFLHGQRIITFSDLNGKLLALKPDVTLSIVKSADNFAERQKLYYTENVYRESKDVHEFKEISQVGLEVLGEIDLYQTVEIIILAIKSLLEIDPNAILDISHMGYTEGLLDCLTDDVSLRAELHNLINGKNAHDIVKLANENSLPMNPVNTAIGLMISNSLNEEAIANAVSNALNARMQNAVKEICSIYEIIKAQGFEKHIRIDLSVTGDPNYYNGILMHGYVHGVPRDVLSGGRYDMLLNKMGKECTNAMGFAIYFDALDRQLHKKVSDCEPVYILYDENSDISAILALTKKLSSEGQSYNAVTKLPLNAKGKVYKITATGTEEEEL